MSHESTDPPVVFPDHPDEDADLERVKAAIKRIGQAHAARCHISLYLAPVRLPPLRRGMESNGCRKVLQVLRHRT